MQPPKCRVCGNLHYGTCHQPGDKPKAVKAPKAKKHKARAK